MELRCPKRNSTGLTIVSLAYQEGLFSADARTHVRAAVVGGNGSDLEFGRTTTRTSHQSALSKRLRPPAKWSHLKVGAGSGLAFLCIGWLVFCVNTVATHSLTVVWFSLTPLGLVSGGIFVLSLYLVWTHNHSSYPQQYTGWDRCFVCQGCGTVSLQ